MGQPLNYLFQNDPAKVSGREVYNRPQGIYFYNFGNRRRERVSFGSKFFRSQNQEKPQSDRSYYLYQDAMVQTIWVKTNCSCMPCEACNPLKNLSLVTLRGSVDSELWGG